MNIIQINNNSWRIEDGTVRFFLFTGKEKALLVDTGRNVDTIIGEIKKLTDLPIIVFNTHCDFDHIKCNHEFDDIRMSAAEFSHYRSTGHSTKNVTPLFEGDTIDLGGREFTVIELPGHTYGSAGLLCKEERILIGGDGIQDGSIYLFGPLRDLAAYKASLIKLRTKYKDMFDVVYPSHANFPVKPDIIDGLIKGAQDVMDGLVEKGEEKVFDGIVYYPYNVGVAVILGDDYTQYSPL